MKEVTIASFNEDVIQSNKLTIVDFWAPWCAPCRMISPILEELSKEHPDVNIVKCNVDENSDLAITFNIRGIPTIMFFKNGKNVDTIVGLVGKDVFVQKINKFK